MNREQFATALAAGPWAWPGGYPLFFISSDGEAISFAAAKDNAALIGDAIDENDNSGWRVMAVDINWEDAALYCAHTGERIPSAYGEDGA